VPIRPIWLEFRIIRKPMESCGRGLVTAVAVKFWVTPMAAFSASRRFRRWSQHERRRRLCRSSAAELYGLGVW
jgi:hypothetical protein